MIFKMLVGAVYLFTNEKTRLSETTGFGYGCKITLYAVA